MSFKSKDASFLASVHIQLMAPYEVLVGGVNKTTDRMQGNNFVYLVLQKLVAGELYEYNTDK